MRRLPLQTAVLARLERERTTEAIIVGIAHPVGGNWRYDLRLPDGKIIFNIPDWAIERH